MRTLLAALALLTAGCKCSEPPAATAAAVSEDALPAVGEGLGVPFEADVVLSVRDRLLLLPTGERCPGAAGCDEALAKLRGRSLALVVAPEVVMAELSVPLEQLGLALDAREEACLAVRDPSARRCVLFRPMSGEGFGEWLDAIKPAGKIRVLMRNDGFEVVTDRGKVLGADRHGPSLPPVDGKLDFAGLDRRVLAIARRFPEEDEAVLAPSGGMKMADVARALALLAGPEGDRFKVLHLVYP